MQIINATRVVKSVMTSGGELITIQPGQLSETFLATPTIIGAAIKLGSEKEIGLILLADYELEQARKISASAPYIYTSVEEAKSKLLDPSINYMGDLNAKKVNLQLEVECQKKDQEIEALKAKIQELEAQRVAPINQRVDELESRLKSSDASLKEAHDELNKKSKRITDYENQISEMSNQLNKVRSDYGALSQNLTVAQKSAEESAIKVDALTSELGQAKSDLVHKTQEYDNVVKNLAEATDNIELMKKTFNEICAQFGITRTESGEYVQNPVTE